MPAAGMGDVGRRYQIVAAYRIYLAKDGEALVILLGGGTKKGQQADISRAKALHQEYKARKKIGLAAEKKVAKGTTGKR